MDLVGVALLVETLATGARAAVGAELSLRVGLGANKEGLLSGSLVLVLAEPGVQARGLEGATVREGESPRVRSGEGEVLDVHGIQVKRGLLLGLATGEELTAIRE